MKTNKSTHDGYSVEMFAPIMKESSGKYIAVLSDTSLDRDEERVGKCALNKIAENPGYIAGLMDHDNKVLNQVAEWTNVQVKDIDGHTALVAEPKFFMSNPNAKIIKGMLDEGAKLGISIGAIVTQYEDEKFQGKNIRTFTGLELLEASFVAIPSNTHGRAMAVAKSFKSKEEIQMEKQFTQEEMDSAVETASKGFKSKEEELNKALKSKESEIEKLNKTIEKNADEAEKAKEEAEKKLAKSVESLEAEKKKSLEKQKFADQGTTKKYTDEDVEKALSEGKLPIGRF